MKPEITKEKTENVQTQPLIIELQYADGRKERFEFHSSTLQIGRSLENDLIVKDPFVSRKHAVLTVKENGRLEISTLSPVNGIVQEGQNLSFLSFVQEGSFRLGKTTIKVIQPGKMSWESSKTLVDEESGKDIRADLLQGKSGWKPNPTFLNLSDLEPSPVEPFSVHENEAETLQPLSPMEMEDEEEDQDEWPAYSLRDRLLKEASTKNNFGKGSLGWEVISYRNEVVLECVTVEKDKPFEPFKEEGPRVRVDGHGDLWVHLNEDLMISQGTESQSFAPLSQLQVSHREKWVQAPRGPFVLLHQGIQYIFRECYLENIVIPPAKTTVQPLNIYFAGHFTWIHLAVVALISLFSSSIQNGNATNLRQEEVNRFVTMALDDLKSEPVVEIQKEKPMEVAPAETKTSKAERPKKTSKKVSVTQNRRSSPKVSQSGSLADISQMGALGKLGGTGLFGRGNRSNKIVAAVSNLSAVRAYGGIQTYSVSGNIAALPGKDVRMAKISNVKTFNANAGNPNGDGFGVASVGVKRKQKVKGLLVDLEPPPMAVSIKGGLTREEIARIVMKHVSAIRYCYEKSLLEDPSLTGKITMKWTISSSGLVTQSGIGSSSVRNAGVHQCLAQEVSTWKFPKPRDNGIVLVSYPFIFDSANF